MSTARLVLNPAFTVGPVRRQTIFHPFAPMSRAMVPTEQETP